MENSKKEENLIMIIWAQALVAMLGSLFYSEIMGYTPCEMCWYQRILMYPLVIIYGAYAFGKRKSREQLIPGMIMSGIGLLVAIYHYMIQKVPAFHEAGGACGIVPCNAVYVNYLGFITIPFMAAVAFAVIFILTIVLYKKKGRVA
ncbi:disulfide oxidoreductase [Aciduricibacillus chroicocephali]|uniref:Probable disulfide formation protein n=1 Tax=Aciduricibacillus chroicocephali TaxID=3054939 RepID=A0ABY9KXK3_9BACI|nr:disulfide oxidoreductase [Bacillaceae bacterium 44XB]